MQDCCLPTERMKSIRSSLDFSLQLVKLWDTHRQGKGSLSHASVQEVRKWVWGLGASLPAPKCTRQIVGSLTFPPQWPTFTFPSNYTSWCTLIYSEHTCIVSEMWEKLGEKHKVPEAETTDLSRFGRNAGILYPFSKQLITSLFLPGNLLLKSRYFVSSNICLLI